MFISFGHGSTLQKKRAALGFCERPAKIAVQAGLLPSFVAVRQQFGLIVESRRQAVGAVLLRHATHHPQRILQP